MRFTVSLQLRLASFVLLLLFALIPSQLLAQEETEATKLIVQGEDARDAGQYDLALSRFQKALELAQKARNGEDTANALLSIGEIYANLGQHKRAVEYYERCIRLIEGTNSRLLPYAYYSIARTSNELGHPDVALGFLQRCLPLFRAANKKAEYASTLDLIGQSYARLRKFDEAMQNQLKSLELYQILGNVRDVARLMTNVGSTAKAKGDTTLAIQFLEKGLELTRVSARPEAVQAAVTNLALLYYDVGKLDQAVIAFSEAININEKVSRQLREASRVGDYQDWFRSSLYRRYAHVLIDLKKSELALAVLERGRMQGLARQAGQNRADFSRMLPPADRKRIQDALAEFRSASAELDKIQGIEFLADQKSDSPQKQRVLAIRSRYDQAERDLLTLRAELFRSSPDYRRLSGSSSPTATDMKQFAAKNPDTLYLQWAVGAEKTSLLFALSADGITSFVLPVGEEELTRQVADWRKAILERSDNEFELARSLYKSLFTAVEEAGLFAFNKYSRLVVCGDGPLLELPFAALVNGRNKRLIESMPVAVTSSFGVLMWPDDRGKAELPMLVLADPVTEVASPLPAARKEGRAVGALFPESKVFVGPSAIRANVMPDLTSSSILHFATHGLLDPDNGLKSGLLLSDEKGKEEPQLLTASDLINMRLSAQLAVLSACETGQGQKNGGEGLLGLTWAFRAAGCPATVASLWSVDDEATGKLMVQFYEKLKVGKRKDEALRDAVLSVMKSHPQPFFWAAFQLSGDTKPLDP